MSSSPCSSSAVYDAHRNMDLPDGASEIAVKVFQDTLSSKHLPVRVSGLRHLVLRFTFYADFCRCHLWYTEKWGAH